MASNRTLQVSIAGGELSPFMFGRQDDGKYQTGAAKLRNIIASPQGPIYNRSGFAFVHEVKSSSKKTRLVPFTYSTDQTMVIEIGDGYFRFHTQGATLLYGTLAAYNGATAYVPGNLVSSGGNNYYCIANTTGNAPPNVTYWYLLPATGEYEVPTNYAEAYLMDLHYVQSSDVFTIVHPNYPPAELRRLGATNWVLTPISFQPSLSAPGSVLATATVAVGPTTTYTYKVTTIGDDGLNESYPSASSSCVNNLFTTGNYNTITWAAATGARRYNVYKQSNGLYGYIGQTDGLTFKDDNIAANLAKTPPETANPFSGAGNYPGAVTYFEQRRAFAGTTNLPQNEWLTKSGTESNLTYSIPSRDDDSISFKVASREANTIRHLVPLNDLITLTSAAEWRVSANTSGALVPSDISVKPQSYIGANNAQPALINNSIIYSASRGGHVMELAYDWRSSGYVTNDISIRSAHLFDNKTIADIAYQKSPIRICWFVSSNGKLLGLTYEPSQQVWAWHQHDTDGLFESIAIVSEGAEDYLYVVVKRTINSVTRRYVERMSSRNFSLQEDMFFVDSGGTYNKPGTFTRVGIQIFATMASPHGYIDGTPHRFSFSDPTFGTIIEARSYIVTVTGANTFSITVVNSGATSGTINEIAITISGINWLEGKTLNILTDGAKHPQRTVVGGSVTLDYYTAKCQLGLPIQADFNSLPLAMQVDNALGQGKMKNINKVILKLYQSRGIFVGPDESNLVEAKQRTTEPYGSPPNLKTGDIDVTIPPSWDSAGQIFVRQDDPLALTIVSITLDVALGG